MSAAGWSSSILPLDAPQDCPHTVHPMPQAVLLGTAGPAVCPQAVPLLPLQTAGPAYLLSAQFAMPLAVLTAQIRSHPTLSNILWLETVPCHQAAACRLLQAVTSPW